MNTNNNGFPSLQNNKYIQLSIDESQACHYKRHLEVEAHFYMSHWVTYKSGFIIVIIEENSLILQPRIGYSLTRSLVMLVHWPSASASDWNKANLSIEFVYKFKGWSVSLIAHPQFLGLLYSLWKYSTVQSSFCTMLKRTFILTIQILNFVYLCYTIK